MDINSEASPKSEGFAYPLSHPGGISTVEDYCRAKKDSVCRYMFASGLADVCSFWA